MARRERHGESRATPAQGRGMQLCGSLISGTTTCPACLRSTGQTFLALCSELLQEEEKIVLQTSPLMKAPQAEGGEGVPKGGWNFNQSRTGIKTQNSLS